MQPILSKDSANRRQCKIKVPKLLFLLLRCSLSYQKLGMKRERHLGTTPAANARRKRLPLISDVGSYLV